ncbi:hypothetical protein L9F63_017495, partial [Diploptera punctata]
FFPKPLNMLCNDTFGCSSVINTRVKGRSVATSGAICSRTPEIGQQEESLMWTKKYETVKKFYQPIGELRRGSFSAAVGP